MTCNHLLPELASGPVPVSHQCSTLCCLLLLSQSSPFSPLSPAATHDPVLPELVSGPVPGATPNIALSVLPSAPLTEQSSLSSGDSQPRLAQACIWPCASKFDWSDFQSPMISELRAVSIGVKSSPGKLDLLIYCPMKGRCLHCNSTLIAGNLVGKYKLYYAVPWPKSILGTDMRCNKCKKHFMTHNPKYVDTPFS